MKTIKFSEKELGFIRQQYQVELEEAEEYVENLKNILNKIGTPEPFTLAEQVAKQPARRGRKPKDQKELTAPGIEPVEKKRKTRRDKGIKRVKKNQPVIQEKSINDTTPALTPMEESLQPDDPEKTVLPKKKGKRYSKKRRGVYLTPLRKPL
jgi:hypothetical protein